MAPLTENNPYLLFFLQFMAPLRLQGSRADANVGINTLKKFSAILEQKHRARILRQRIIIRMQACAVLALAVWYERGNGASASYVFLTKVY